MKKKVQGKPAEAKNPSLGEFRRGMAGRRRQMRSRGCSVFQQLRDQQFIILMDHPRGAPHHDHPTDQFEHAFSVFSIIFEAISTYGRVRIRMACQTPNTASAVASTF